MRISLTNIKKSLIEQLEKKGANVDCFVDMVESYIFFTQQERKMQADIRKRGLSYKATSATGKEYTKDNPSIKNAAMYNKQRLSILKDMGLSINTIEAECDDEL